MDWTEKLEKLIGNQDYADIERAAGIRKNTLSAKLKRKQEPRVRLGLRLAKALGVDPGWLFDDKRGMDERVEALIPADLSDPAATKMIRLIVAAAMRAAAEAIVESVQPGQPKGEKRKPHQQR